MECSYYAVFEYSSEEEKNKGYSAIGIFFQDVPVNSCADNTEHGLEMAKEASSLYIEGMLADGETLPTPSEKIDLEKNLLPNEKLFRITVEM